MKLRRTSLAVVLMMGIVAQPRTSAAQSPTPASAQPPAAAGAPMSPEALDKLVAPIALYPDALIIQIVGCAASPYQVKQLRGWLAAHPELKGSAVQDAV